MYMSPHTRMRKSITMHSGKYHNLRSSNSISHILHYRWNQLALAILVSSFVFESGNSQKDAIALILVILFFLVLGLHVLEFQDFLFKRCKGQPKSTAKEMPMVVMNTINTLQ
jgi:hypothetical protein